MSHFSVLVIGDVDYNMAPFHEFECDGIDDEFIQNVDETEERRKDFEEAKKRYAKELADGATPDQMKYSFKGTTFREYLSDYCEIPIVASEKDIDLSEKSKHKWGYAIDLGDDKFKVIRRTNPNKFYDYYGSGYRAFKLKSNGQFVDTAQKKDIDFEGMFAKAEKEARETYRAVIKALGYKEGQYPRLTNTWASLVDKFCPDDGSEPTMTRDEADAAYKKQAAVKRWGDAHKQGKFNNIDVGFWSKVDDFAMSEDDYVKSQTIHSLSYGYVVNRQYFSRGRMGWWAISTGEMPAEQWDAQYKKFLDELPDDAELSMLDCHI